MNEKFDLTPAADKQAVATRNGVSPPTSGDVLSFVEIFLRRWRWLLIGGVVSGLMGFAGGLFLWRNSFTAPAQLIRYDSPNAVEVFGNRQAAPQTLPSILHSPELLQRVAAQAHPPLSASALAANLRVMPEHDSDIIVVTVSGGHASAAADLVNLYAHEAVQFTKDMQARAASEIVRFSTQQLARVESEIAVANRQLEGSPAKASTNAFAPRASSLAEKVQDARDELAGLLGQYTDAHPLVQAKRAEIAALQNELASERS